MIKKIENMIMTLIPDAIKDVDFKVEIVDNLPVITMWNTAKLGALQNLEDFRNAYLAYVARKKAVIPSYDDSDPMPWLNVDKIAETQKVPKVVNINQNPAIPLVKVKRYAM